MTNAVGDVREALSALEGTVSPHTLARVRAGYDRIPSLLERCGGLSRGRALDVGCGSGFDSFALGEGFAAVTGIDPNRAAIAEATRIARESGADHVDFLAAGLDELSDDSVYDLVFCNLMSHNVPSRLALLTGLRRRLAPGGWLIYSECGEGYAPRDIARAIATRNAAELRLRIRQLRSGLTGEPVFRFFPAHSLSDALDRVGLLAMDTERQRWRGLVTVQMVWCQATSEDEFPLSGDGDDPDHAWRKPGMDGVRAAFRELFDDLCREGSADEAIDRLAAMNLPTPYDGFVELARMANLLPRNTACGKRSRWRDTLLRLLHGDPDWVALAEIEERFERGLEPTR
ncbi:MAG: class I SAM-dependent methyltransferase [Gammaproteobacteria bacterium]